MERQLQLLYTSLSNASAGLLRPPLESASPWPQISAQLEQAAQTIAVLDDDRRAKLAVRVRFVVEAVQLLT